MCACAGRVRGEPLQALRVRDRMRGDERDVLQARAGAGDEHEVDGHEVLAHDPDARHRGEGILRGRDAAVDRVLDRDHRGVRAPLDDVGQRLADVVHRAPLLPAGFGDLRERRLGEGSGGTEEAVGAARGFLGLESHALKPSRAPRRALGAECVTAPARDTQRDRVDPRRFAKSRPISDRRTGDDASTSWTRRTSVSSSACGAFVEDARSADERAVVLGGHTRSAAVDGMLRRSEPLWARRVSSAATADLGGYLPT